MNLVKLSNRNLTYSFQKELEQIKNGTPGTLVLTPTQRATLRKYGLIESSPGCCIKVTEKAEKIMDTLTEDADSG